jgi:cysteine desulfurase
MTDPIYLDHNATTPVAEEVFAAMAPWLREQHGNPSSSHAYGRRAAQAVATARAQVAGLIGAQPGEIVFSGCATEANNLALLGVARAIGSRKCHLVISSIEHPAVAAPAMALREQGWDVTVLPVDGFGQVSAIALLQALRPDTALVSVMHANNEVGTLQPIAAIAEITRARGILMHTDVAQSAGKLALDVDDRQPSNQG